MKKILSLILITTLCFTAFSSCGNTETTPTTGSTANTQAPHISTLPAYESYICDMANDGYIQSVDKDWWMGGYTNEKVSELTLKVNMPDKEYTVNYRNTYQSNGAAYKTHTYKDSRGELTYYVNATTGKSVGFFLEYSKLMNEDSLPNVENYKTEMLTLADNYAKQYIDLSNYKRTYTEKEFDDHLPNTTIYDIIYTKYYNGTATNDKISIQITSKGTIRKFTFNNTSAFDNISLTIDMQKLTASIETKINASYSQKILDYSINEQYLAYSPNGDPIIISKITITLETENAQHPTTETALLLATAV